MRMKEDMRTKRVAKMKAKTVVPAAGPAPPSVIVKIPKLEIKVIQVHLVGDSLLLVHQWGEKSKRAMKKKQGKEPTKGREVRDPEAEFHASYYKYPGGGYGFPAIAFKAAAVRAAKGLGMPMTDARAAFHIPGDLVKIEGSEPEMHEAMVRLPNRMADLRYRAMFFPWETRFPVRFNPFFISAAQLLNLFNHAGFGTGVGEHRPQKDGSYGMFHVAADTEEEEEEEAL